MTLEEFPKRFRTIAPNLVISDREMRRLYDRGLTPEQAVAAVA